MSEHRDSEELRMTGCSCVFVGLKYYRSITAPSVTFPSFPFIALLVEGWKEYPTERGKLD